MPRRITKAKINFISLVPRGANQLPVIYKEDGTFEFDTLVKASDGFDEKGELLAVVYAPEVRDSQGDIASAEVIKDMMYDAAKRGLRIDLRHDGKAVKPEDAYVAESFIVQKGDERFTGMKDYSGKPVDVSGGWGVVMKIESPDLRKLYRDGKWNGVSMGGSAEVLHEKEDSLGRQMLDFLKKTFGGKPTGDDMDIKELNAALAENNKALVTGMKDIFKEAGIIKDPAQKKDEPAAKADDAPKYEGDYSAESLAKHARIVRRHQITKSIDWAKPDSIAKAQEEIAKIEAEEKKSAPTKEGDGLTAEEKAASVTKEDSAEVRELKVRLFKAQKSSNQDAGTGVRKEAVASEGILAGTNITKEDVSLAEQGRKLGRALRGLKD